MKLIILPGNSLSNKAWADEWKSALKPYFSDVIAISYEHWIDDSRINMEKETLKLKDIGKNTPCIIFAKSIGAFIAIKAIHEGYVQPQKCVFIGFPISLKDNPFPVKDWMESFNVPTLIIQNEHDPITSFKEVQASIGHKDNIRYESLPGDTHKYPADTEVVNRVRTYLDKNR